VRSGRWCNVSGLDAEAVMAEFFGKLLRNVVVISLVLAVISFFAAPAVAFLAMRAAAEADDAAGLARLIDYPAVRQSLRPQLDANPAAVAPAPTFMEDPIGAVRRQIEQAAAPAAPNVDAYLTPPAIAALTRGEGRYAAQRSTGPQPSRDGTNTGGPLPTPVYWGVNRARMSVTDEGGSDTLFTFERVGVFEWKLVHVGLAAGTAPNHPQRATGAARATPTLPSVAKAKPAIAVVGD
jgi:hypothetical protein